MVKNTALFMAKLLLGAFIALVIALLASYFDLPIFRDAGGGVAAAQQRQPPPQTVGQGEELLRTLDLSNELESTKGRTLRMRRITVQPGGALALHNHVDRPAITYLLSGEMTYHQEGKPDRIIHVGDGFAEGKATTHWAENTGKVPAVWVAVDIVKP